jgi:cytochrome o ubiquinol oxidase subunit 3
MSATDIITTPGPAGDPGAVDAPGHGAGGPASRFVVVSFGFWVFLLSDIVMFSALFAAHAVLQNHTAGGPSGRQLFSLPRVAVETGCLLLSSFTCGLMTIAARSRQTKATYLAAAVTIALGATFLGLELSEFAGMIARGDGPSRSAFLSSFFTLVGTHGLHVTGGLTWLVIMMAQVATRGFRPTVMRRLYCFGLFWHALDIVWVAVFTVVYLMGVIG